MNGGLYATEETVWHWAMCALCSFKKMPNHAAYF